MQKIIETLTKVNTALARLPLCNVWKQQHPPIHGISLGFLHKTFNLNSILP